MTSPETTQAGKHRGEHIRVTSSQYDRPMRKTPGVGGQLVTTGGFSDLISSSAGTGVPWLMDTCCQYPHIMTNMHEQAHNTDTHMLTFNLIQAKVWDLMSRLHADATPELSICYLATHLTSLIFPTLPLYCNETLYQILTVISLHLNTDPVYFVCFLHLQTAILQLLLHLLFTSNKIGIRFFSQFFPSIIKHVHESTNCAQIQQMRVVQAAHVSTV